ncbi:hypothetical protein ACIQVL_31545 [Streptomyces sp. NPDC090499]|uniref:SCO2400 family protein n=1 Tax=Streptomyces sp. NPDC090499 TaxID=3365965 RepID=UPI00382FB57B
MDYCSSCRRHLNGALACPGCGAYAPDMVPRAVVAPAATGAASWQAPAATAWFDTGSYADEAEESIQETAEEAAEGPYDGPDAALPAPLGRAARRRQRARWKKNQRRAVVATAVALVGGGLTVASLDRQGADRAQAATAPDNRPMGLADEQATDADPAASAPTGRHRAPDQTLSARSVTANAPHEQTSGVPQATPTPGQDTATSAARTTVSAARSRSAATVSGTATGAASAATATPTPTATTATTTTGTAAATSAPSASPAPTASATSPSQLCLLVICLG